MKKPFLVARTTIVSVLALAAFLPNGICDDLEVHALSMENFLQTLLREQPRFRVAGTFTSEVSGKPPVTSGATARFDTDAGAIFSYNTTGEDVEPYDFAYWKRTLLLFVFDRNRKKVLKVERIGAPLRPIFNFVWDVLEEAKHGGGFKTFILSGLMRGTVEEINAGTIKVSFRKRFIPLPIQSVTFLFDRQYRLKALTVVKNNGDRHRFDVRHFEKMTHKLPKPKIPQGVRIRQ